MLSAFSIAAAITRGLKDDRLLHIVGECDARIFGRTPGERLERQTDGITELVIVADAAAVLDDAAIAWLGDHAGSVIASPGGRPLAVAVAPAERERAAAALDGRATGLTFVTPDGEMFVRKLRRRVPLIACSLREQSARTIERRLFDNVYKGVTDLVTKWVWPEPAFWVTRACANLGITPNMVTWLGVLLVLAAGVLFYQGAFVAGLGAAWLMTFLDTVDGKLARVTGTSSAFGNLLDHGTDVLHPPVWWYCLAHGIATSSPDMSGPVWSSLWVILGCYVVGRGFEVAFHKGFGFNPYIWQPFDSRFRLIVSRRNIILLVVSLGLAAGAVADAFLLCAAWSVVSTAIQGVRLAQAFAARQSGPVTSWLY
jgi:phosphatidylglycerophosphate synthase